ncbi:hypothetical protein [Longimicrobium sp.]|uniref:hypothetical protein n=1 Tax=Longimicrobium sp. TaxID=2029185 RepID=UPI002BF82BCE|nr:hypothetical protein [Longimicrobium sp.]HSU17195.1 hypothetical protein [Longimicrobium sp.]
MRRARFLSALPAVAVLGACSLFGRGVPGETVTLEINNNLALPAPVTVYAYSDVGSRQLVGSLVPDKQAVLRFHSAHITGSYRFVAVVRRGAQLVSNSVSLTGGETVTWELRNNVLLVAR